MELVEFLLARIAEDEAVARDVLRYPTAPGYVEMDGPWVCHDQSDHVAMPPARVVAECEAKRRIVEGCAKLRRVLDHYGVPTSFDDEDVLALLALPYADHPDYREKWRPTSTAGSR